MAERNITTQTEMAERINLSKSQFSQMLSDDYCPVKTNVLTLMNYLDLPLTDVITTSVSKDVINEKGAPYMTTNTSLVYHTEQTSLFEDKLNRFDYKIESYKDVANAVPKANYTSIETFAGAGGLALGLEEAGFQAQALVEIDSKAVQTLRYNRPEWNVIEEDINEVANNNILNYFDSDTDIDLLSGGYPCQSFSYAGLRHGLEDTRGTLFYPFAKLLNQVRPKVFIAENVKGLVNHDKGRTLEIMIDTFTEAGYDVSWNVLSAWDYNVAQKRERIFIVGIRNDLKEREDHPFFFPMAQEYKPVLKDILSDVPDSPGLTYSEKKHAVMELVPPGGSWVDLPEDVAKEYMGASYYSGGGKRGMARRLSWDEPSLTLTTSPVQKQTERCHPEETRPFTVREYARIQSFPDSWEFQGNVSNQYKQIGNAVPVNLAKAVGLAVVDYLNQFD